MFNIGDMIHLKSGNVRSKASACAWSDKLGPRAYITVSHVDKIDHFSDVGNAYGFEEFNDVNPHWVNVDGQFELYNEKIDFEF